MHRVLKTADARVTKHCHGDLVAGHRARDDDCGDLKTKDESRTHNGAASISAKLPNEDEIIHRYRCKTIETKRVLVIENEAVRNQAVLCAREHFRRWLHRMVMALSSNL